MFWELEGEKVFETDNLVAAPTNVDELNMYIQNGYVAKDTSESLSSANPTISVTAPKPISSNTDSRSVFPTEIPPFSYQDIYPITTQSLPNLPPIALWSD